MQNHTKNPKKSIVCALIKLIRAHAKDIHLICLGPLTNLAMAIRLAPDIVPLISSVTVMAGSSSGKGNATVAAEFNIHCDPEAAHIVLSTLPEEISPHLITWDLAEESALPWYMYDELTKTADKLTKDADDSEAKFLKVTNSLYESLLRDKHWPGPVAPHIHHVVQEKKLAKKDNPNMSWSEIYHDGTECHANAHLFIPCDAIAVAIFLHPELVKKQQKVACLVELTGKFSRGGIFFDWYANFLKHENSIVVHEIDPALFIKLLSIRLSHNNPLKFKSFKLTDSTKQ